MEKTTFIWDLDGTLLDSYGAIMHALEATYQAYGWAFDYKVILDFILSESVGALLTREAHERHVSFDALKAYYSKDLKTRDHEIRLLPGARKVLDWTLDVGISNYVYTHKGNNAFAVLDQLGLSHYFKEVITGEMGFKRKPHPEAINYLLDKYHLSKEQTYYIGDRRLDMELALNAGIHSLSLTQDTQEGNQKIANLDAILNLFDKDSLL